MFLSFFLSNNFQRRRLLKQTQSSVMQDYLANAFPEGKTLLKDTDIVAIDFETTGLSIEKDNIISVGAVQITNMEIALGSSYHQVVNSECKLPEQSIVIHNITDNTLAQGVKPKEAIQQLLALLSGKVMLVHNAQIELGFLKKLCREFYKTDFIIPVIDTQRLAQRRFERQGEIYRDNELRLFNLRQRYGLPQYKAHNAQMDALATAELFLAMTDKHARLRDYLS